MVRTRHLLGVAENCSVVVVIIWFTWLRNIINVERCWSRELRLILLNVSPNLRKPVLALGNAIMINTE